MRDLTINRFFKVALVTVLITASGNLFAAKSVVCPSSGTANSSSGAKEIAFQKIDKGCFRSFLQDNCAVRSENQRNATYKFDAKEIGGNCFENDRTKQVTCKMDYRVTCDEYK